MPSKDLFFKRMRRERGEEPDVYTYDRLPEPLRVQIVAILRDLFGSYRWDPDRRRSVCLHGHYQEMVMGLRREFGCHQLYDQSEPKGPYRTHTFQDECETFILKATDTDRVLSVVELFMQIASVRASNGQCIFRGGGSFEAAREELNERFRWHGVGYQFEGNRIVRIDSDLLHHEVVVPVLQLLRQPRFAGPNEEFIGAHEHYRHGMHEEAIAEALKALESTLKTLLMQRGVAFPESATAKRLLDEAFANDLIPSALGAQFTALRSLLESGVPTIRNRQGGHGQGPEVRRVPAFVAAFALHLAGAAIVFLVASASQATANSGPDASEATS